MEALRRGSMHHLVPTLVLFLTLLGAAAAGEPRLVEDIETAAAGARPWGLAVLGDRLLFFTGRDLDRTAEIWSTDGSPAGARLLRAGIGRSPSPAEEPPIPAGGKLFFLAGGELWRSDGTPEGTGPVAGSFTGPSNAIPGGDRIYFAARDGLHGAELWQSDGTPEGTGIVEDIEPGPGDSRARPIIAAGGLLYFTLGDRESELWATDGSPGGARIVTILPPGSGARIVRGIHATGGHFYFTTWSSVIVPWYSLWRSDGTPEGTLPLADLESPIEGLCPLGGRLYFPGYSGDHGLGLWSTDGTPAGTGIVDALRDVIEGRALDLGDLLVHSGRLLFTAWDPCGGRDAWATDGTAAGTIRLTGGIAGSGAISFGDLVEAGGRLFFSSQNPDGNRELWTGDGTPGGCRRLGVRLAGVDRPVAFGGRLYFPADGGPERGAGLWASDGTPGGTGPAADLPSTGTTGSWPARYVPLGPRILFVAGDHEHGREIRAAGGDEGVALLADIIPGAGGSDPDLLTPAGGKAFFIAGTDGSGREPWITGGTRESTFPLGDIAPGPASPEIGGFVALGGRVFFTAGDPSCGREPWTSDGTSAGTRRIADIFPGPRGSWPEGMAAAGGWVWFTAEDPVHGVEVWRTDGTPGGTTLVADLVPGLRSSRAGEFTALGSRVFFRVEAPAGGDGLWASDGTAGGTARVIDVPVWSGWHPPVELGGRLYFTSFPPGAEGGLFVTDGTPGGTERLAEPAWRVRATGGRLFFTAAGTGETWTSDGTREGTRPLGIAAGEGWPVFDTLAVFEGSAHVLGEGPDGMGILWSEDRAAGEMVPRKLPLRLEAWTSAIGSASALHPDGRLFFSAGDGETGAEPWELRIGEPPVFRRGDADGSGTVDLADAVAILESLFLGAGPLPCEDAADGNDDGRLDISDPMMLLGSLFLGTGPLPEPAACGADPTADLLAPCTMTCTGDARSG